MQIYFDAPEFDSQLLRALSYAYYQGADIGECLTTAFRIKPKDFDSWFAEWNATAERIFAIGENCLAENCKESAKLAFLRASNYYRASIFFLYGSPIDPRLIEAYDKHCLAFSKAIDLFTTPVESVQIPYQNTYLPGYFYKADQSPEKKPTVIISNGFDSTQQECYLLAGAAAISRGYNVLCFDGPGQGQLLIKEGIYMRHDWEHVITPVIDFLEKREDVDTSKIILYGPSWGGYLMARAAAFEHRVAALITNPGQFDIMIPLKKAFPGIVELIHDDPNNEMGKNIAQALSNPMLAAKMRAKLWIHNADSPSGLLKLWLDYNLFDASALIECPTLVLDSENESLSAGQAELFFDSLRCLKFYHLFTAKDGAGEHCEAGARSLSNQYIFDWLQKSLVTEQALKDWKG